MSVIDVVLVAGIDHIPRDVARIAITIAVGVVLAGLVRQALPWLIERAVRTGIAGFDIGGDGRRRISRRVATLTSFLTRSLQSLILVFTGMVVLAELGVRVEALLASAGILGIALAFGAQTIVRDSLSGLFILAQGPFDLGDYVRLNALEGTVAQISLRGTTLVSDDGVVHTMANGAISQTSNYTRDAWNHVFTLTVKREVPLERIQRAVADVAAELSVAPELGEEQLSGPTLRGITAIRGASYDVEVRSVVPPALRTRYPQLVLARLARALEAHEVELA